MKQKNTPKKHPEKVTFVLKNQKEKNYFYTLKNGQVLEFPNKVFPTGKQTTFNQLELF